MLHKKTLTRTLKERVFFYIIIRPVRISKYQRNKVSDIKNVPPYILISLVDKHQQQKCHGSQWIVINCNEFSWPFMNCHELLWNVMICYDLSSIVMNHYELSWTDMNCHEWLWTSWNVMNCYELSWIIMNDHELL